MQVMVQGQFVFVWQVEVEYDQVDVFVFKYLMYVGVIVGGVDLVIGVFQLFGKQLVDIVVVVDD